jgi:hypothetical protein
VERRDVLAHHVGPEHRVRVHRQRGQDRFVRDPCNQAMACPAIASQSSTAQPSSALHSKIVGLVFGSSTEASAASSLSWLSKAD